MATVYALLSVDVWGKELIPNSRFQFLMCINFRGIWVQNFVWEKKDGLRNTFIYICIINGHTYTGHTYFSINHGVE